MIGQPGVGKSTLIRRVLRDIGLPTCGFETVKEQPECDGENGYPLYIYTYGEEHIRSADNLAGYCKPGCSKAYPETFDRFARRVSVPEECRVVVMDELGFMESEAYEFQNTVLSLLDGPVPVIAAVKSRSSVFLDAVKAHSDSRCFYIDKDNREELYDSVLAFMKEQTK